MSPPFLDALDLALDAAVAGRLPDIAARMPQHERAWQPYQHVRGRFSNTGGWQYTCLRFVEENYPRLCLDVDAVAEGALDPATAMDRAIVVNHADALTGELDMAISSALARPPRERPMRYAIELALVAPRDGRLALTTAGAAVRAVHGTDRVALLIALEVAQSHGRADPWRLDLELARALCAGPWSASTIPADEPMQHLAATLRLARLGRLGVVVIPEGTDVPETCTPTALTRRVIEPVLHGFDAPTVRRALALLRDEPVTPGPSPHAAPAAATELRERLDVIAEAVHRLRAGEAVDLDPIVASLDRARRLAVVVETSATLTDTPPDHATPPARSR